MRPQMEECFRVHAIQALSLEAAQDRLHTTLRTPSAPMGAFFEAVYESVK